MDSNGLLFGSRFKQNFLTKTDQFHIADQGARSSDTKQSFDLLIGSGYKEAALSMVLKKELLAHPMPRPLAITKFITSFDTRDAVNSFPTRILMFRQVCFTFTPMNKYYQESNKTSDLIATQLELHYQNKTPSFSETNFVCQLLISNQKSFLAKLEQDILLENFLPDSLLDFKRKEWKEVRRKTGLIGSTAIKRKAKELVQQKDFARSFIAKVSTGTKPSHALIELGTPASLEQLSVLARKHLGDHDKL